MIGAGPFFLWALNKPIQESLKFLDFVRYIEQF